MSIDEQRKIRELYEAARDRPEPTRMAWIQAQRQYSPETVEAVLQLLRAANNSAGFLSQPVLRRAQPVRREGRRIGPYRILGEIGSGGMGIVYKCERDDDFRHIAALKVVRSDVALHVDKFHNERQILAGLNHDNIARILDGGTTEDGLPYLVMDYIDGVPIDTFCNAKKASLAQRINLVRQTCVAVAYLHEQGVLHRDLKPSNILVTPGGQVKLLDFGIAKQMNATGEAATTQRPFISWEFSSPEQVSGHRTSRNSDVYSLGALLYRMLTGRPALDFAGERWAETPRIIAEVIPGSMSAALTSSRPADPAFALPVSMTEWKKLLQGDLDRIVAMALRKEPQRRYRSAAELADDLRRYQQRQPVSARGNSPAYVTWRFISRNRASIAATLIVASSLSVAGVTSAKLYSNPRKVETLNRRQTDKFRKLAKDIDQLDNKASKEQTQHILADLHDMESDYETQIKPMLGSPLTPRREIAAMSHNSVTYLNQLVPEVLQHPDVAVPLANAYLNVSKVQWNGQGKSLDDPSAALGTARTGINLMEPALEMLDKLHGNTTAAAASNVLTQVKAQADAAKAAAEQKQ